VEGCVPSCAVFAMVDRLPVEEGWVYGQKPKEPEAPPDLESLFEAAGVPDRLTHGEPPFSPEWYAGAKERQRLRDLEIEKLQGLRNDTRHQWAELVWTDLEIWQERIDFTVSLPEPLGDLQALLARTRHERPDDIFGFKAIQEIAEKAEVRQVQVRADLADAKQRMTEIEDKIRKREAEDEIAEKERLEKKRLAEQRLQAAQRYLNAKMGLSDGVDLSKEEPESTAGNERGNESNDAEDVEDRSPSVSSPKAKVFKDSTAEDPDTTSPRVDAEPEQESFQRPQTGRLESSVDSAATPPRSAQLRASRSAALEPLPNAPVPLGPRFQNVGKHIVNPHGNMQATLPGGEERPWRKPSLGSGS